MKHILLEIKGAVGTLTIDRQDALNALNFEVLKELSETLDSLDFNRVNCLIIRGAGTRAFVSGADIAEMKNFSVEEGHNFSVLGNNVFTKLDSLPIPTIAAVCGYALGGGCELSMACDIRLASESAVFSQPEMGLGIIPGFGGTQRLAVLVGVGRAKELLYTGRRISASEALNIGLVNAVYPTEIIFEEAEKMAQRIAKNSPTAMRAVKKAVNKTYFSDLHTNVEANLFASCFETEEQRAAMEAFIERTIAKKEKEKK
ncbi:MAG: enoyl-CoA hydratase/isomerase family protein [Clostridia bacterium]|nr:enoyl-CoA hydratase/isomerase family protein [Clostridia bacterium]